MHAALSSARARHTAALAVGLLVSVGGIYLALRGVALHDAGRALADSDPLWLAPAAAVFAAGVWLRALRWWTLFDADGRPALREVTRALLIGYFFNSILPARAGEAARVISLHARTGTPRAQTLGTIVSERVLDALAALVILFCAYPWLPAISWLRSAAIFAVIALVAIAVLVFVLVRYEEQAIVWLLRPLRRVRGGALSERLELVAVNATRGMASLRDPRLAARGLVLTVASWLVLSVSFWCLMQGFSLDVPFVAGPLVMVAINLGLVLPSAPAAFGVFEAAAVTALDAFDVGHAQALSYALVLHLLNLVPFLVAGAVLLGPGALRRRGGRGT